MKVIMSTLTISLSLASGFAQAAINDLPAPKTRAQVVAELQEAKADGLLVPGEFAYPPPLHETGSVSRQEVKSELAAARAAGMVSEGELDYPPAVPFHSTKTRAEVKAELQAADQSGQLHAFIEP